MNGFAIIPVIIAAALTAAMHLWPLVADPRSPDKFYDSVVRIEVDWALVERNEAGIVKDTKQQQPIRGTAFVISEQGYALTAAHVLYGWSYARGRPYTHDDVQHKSLAVFRDNRFSVDPPRGAAVVNGGSPSSIFHERDVALIKIEGGGPWEPLCLADIKSPARGTPLTALGYNFRRNSLSVTAGIMKNEYGTDGNWETDIPIERGDSGGPILDQQQRVVGIARAAYGGTTAKSIIPIERFEPLVQRHTSHKCGWFSAARHSPILRHMESLFPDVGRASPEWAIAASVGATGFFSYFVALFMFVVGRYSLAGIAGRSSKPVVVIGSVMVDVVARVDSDAQRRDRVGVIDLFAVGGCAYNIYFSLASMGVPAHLVTAIRRDSPFRKMIMGKIRSISKHSHEVRLIEDAPEAMFIAQRYKTTVIQAVSSTTMDKWAFTEDWICARLSGVKIIVIDLSLTSDQIDKILVQAARNNAEVVCNGTSDDRIVRLKDLKKGRVTSLICSEDEFVALTGMAWEHAMRMTSSDVCHASFCKQLIVTRSDRGFSVFDPLLDDGKPKAYPAGTDQKSIKSTMGAGDALTACFAAARFQEISRGTPFSFDSFHTAVKAKLPSILGVEYSTPGADRK